MVAINFTTKRERLESGIKIRTTREDKEGRLGHIMRAENLEIYWKQRTTECVKLFDAKAVDYYMLRFMPYVSEFAYHELWPYITRMMDVDTGPMPMSDKVLESYVRDEGFDSWEELGAWFTDHYGDRLFSTPFFSVRFGKKR